MQSGRETSTERFAELRSKPARGAGSRPGIANWRIVGRRNREEAQPVSCPRGSSDSPNLLSHEFFTLAESLTISLYSFHFQRETHDFTYSYGIFIIYSSCVRYGALWCIPRDLPSCRRKILKVNTFRSTLPSSGPRLECFRTAMAVLFSKFTHAIPDVSAIQSELPESDRSWDTTLSFYRSTFFFLCCI